MTTTTYQIITPDGVTFNLDGAHYRVAGILDNIGMPPVRSYTHQVPGQPGAVLDDLLDDVRIVTISLAAHDCDIEKTFQAMNDHMANFRYNRTLTLQPLKLRVTVDTASADLYCYYGGMITSQLDNVHALYGFTLVAYDPYWYATSESSTALDSTDTLAVHNILGKVNGLWTAMSDPGTGQVMCMAKDAAGDLYVGGNFTDWDGIAAADYIAKYDVSAGTWSAVGATPLNGQVLSIAIAANGDIYIGGGFTDAGGVATADYIAVLLSGGADWTSITAGGAADAQVEYVLLTDDGYLWAGGSFDNIGGGAAVRVAQYDIAAGTWSAAAGLTAPGIVYAMAQGQDGTVYIGGSFTNASADPDADYIAYWTGAAWANVGGAPSASVYTLCVASDGVLYAGGIFTSWGGVTEANYIGKWDGSAVSGLDNGTDAVVYDLHIDDDNVLYVGGSFTTAGDEDIFGLVAMWNGQSWSSLPVTIPAGASAARALTIGDNLFVGFNGSGNAYVPGDANVTYAGNVAFPPTITITPAAAADSCTLRSIRNETTGVEIIANLFIAKDEIVTIDLGDPGEIPAGKTISTSWAYRPGKNNLLGKIMTPVELARFTLAPAPIAAAGVNLINCKTTGGAADMTCYFWNRYDSLQAAVD